MGFDSDLTLQMRSKLQGNEWNVIKLDFKLGLGQ